LAWPILIAGPNGAGKTTLTGDPNFQKQLKLFPGGAVRLVSPDEAAKVYYASNPGITVCCSFSAIRPAGSRCFAEKYQGQLLWYGGSRFPNLGQRLGAQPTQVAGPGTGGMPFPPKP